MPLVPPSITCLVKIEPATNTSKFWALGFVPTATGVPTIKLWWGRIGTQGDSDTLAPFASEAAMLAEAERRTAAKLREGYVRVAETDFALPFLPALPLLSEPPRDSDGWPVDDRGLSRRPSERRPPPPLIPLARKVLNGRQEWVPQAVERARSFLMTEPDPDGQARPKPKPKPKRAEQVKLVSVRVIDFEE